MCICLSLYIYIYVCVPWACQNKNSKRLEENLDLCPLDHNICKCVNECVRTLSLGSKPGHSKITMPMMFKASRSECKVSPGAHSITDFAL